MVLLCITACLSLCGCMAQEERPVAKRGVLDLSAWDVERRGPLRLNGQWEVRWEPSASQDQANDADTSGSEFTSVPGPWTRTMPGASLLRATGGATLRLTVLRGAAKPSTNAKTSPQMALRLGNISAAWTLKVDGNLVAHSGVPGKNAASEAPQFSAQVIPLHAWDKPADSPLELELHVSNHHYREGGVLEPLWLGVEDDLLARERRESGIAMFLAGTLFIMGLYHVAMHQLRRSDPAPLLFGLYCLLWLGNYLCTDSSAWAARAILPGLPGLGLERFGMACLFLSVPVGYAFFRSLYPRELPRFLLRYASLTGAASAALALLGPSLWFSAVVPAYYLSTAALILFCASGLGLAWSRGREGAACIFAGFLAVALAGVNDMLTDLQLINSAPILPLGMLLFVLAQAFALSQRLQHAFSAVETLSIQVESKNMSLEAEMEQRGKLEREIINISEEERRRMSVDLHDGLCQLLTAARLRCAILGGMPRSEAQKAELDKLSLLLDEMVDQAYDLSHGLWPLEHGPQGAGPSLADMIRRLSRLSGVPISLAQERGCETCPNGNTTQLFRIAQEAISNAVKHAAPTRIEVDFRCQSGGMAELTVRDDGIGRSAAKPGKGGLGMGIMAHRARIIGGDLRVEDAVGGGTMVTCSVPCLSHTPAIRRASL